MTKKYLIVGNPINHSLSPKVHNYWFKENMISAHYDKRELNNDDLVKIITKIKNDELSGINITVPFKQIIIPFLDQLSDLAKKTQSVNTVYKKNNLIIGDNTDVFGFENSLVKKNFDFKNKSAFIFGAGGVVPSIIFALQNLGFNKIIVTNRTFEKLEKLKRQFPLIQTNDWGNFEETDLVINATSLGLKNGNDFNFNFSNTKNEVIYIDTIYNPLETKTFKYLKEAGRKVFNGLDMFIYQGQKSFYLWNKVNPEIDDELVELLNSKLK